jgi:hypothetical protein
MFIHNIKMDDYAGDKWLASIGDSKMIEFINLLTAKFMLNILPIPVKTCQIL